MHLALQHTDSSPYVRCGIFIKHASPKVWLTEITRMQLKLSDCTLYPCPGMDANSISGVLIIFKTAQKRIEVRNNLCVQKVQKGFYIPEHTQLNMALTQEEYTKMFQGKPHFFHHQYGFIELKEEVAWEALLQIPNEQFPVIETPSKGVHIPMKVTAFSVEIEEKETEDALEAPFGKEAVDPKELPFDMKKVLEGNNKEVDKYLKYLEKNPEAALKMAVPLDMLGTSRGKALAKYKFKSNFFESIGLGNSSENTKNTFKTIIGILAIVAIFWIGSYVVDQAKKKEITVVPGKIRILKKEDQNSTLDPVVIEVNKTTTNGSQKQSKPTKTVVQKSKKSTNDNSYKVKQTAEEMLWQSVLLAIIIVFGFITIVYFIVLRVKRNIKARVAAKKKTASSWLDLPEDDKLFSFEETEKKPVFDLYFGGNELSKLSKISIVLVITILLAYLFYPMINAPGIGKLFMIIAGVIVIRLLYLLINKNKTIIND